ncbi:response regulator [Rhodospira trueperi]|uniref:Two-component system, chemotaxis family, response regulator CheY n=1 Tax=Rhodospira trueperi TaxID=69960 RepID=A0A1G7HAR6_9PROT|nr:response regulator [Rhodospira trueperi]SDE97508.1 two-component system, chemotaxis family, response regulator CheY [Rhodospira trueperi]
MAKPRVLIIDDAATVRAFHRHLLEGMDLEVDEAVNGVEGLEKALRQPFDLWLVDVNMPTMDGIRFLFMARQNDRIRDVPAIMITTESELRDKTQALENGANLFLVKPVDPDVFRSRVAVMLGRRAA